MLHRSGSLKSSGENFASVLNWKEGESGERRGRTGERLKRNGYKFLRRSIAVTPKSQTGSSILHTCSQPAPHAFLSSVAWHPGGQPATPATQRAGGCIGLLLSTALDLFRSVQGEKNFFLSSWEGGKEGAGGREGRASWKSTWRGGRSPIPRGKRLRMKKKSSALPSRSAPCSMDSIGYLARVWQRESEMRGGAGERGDMSLVPYMTCGMRA